METLKELEESGINMTEHEKEVYELTRHLDKAHNEIERLEALLRKHHIHYGETIQVGAVTFPKL